MAVSLDWEPLGVLLQDGVGDLVAAHWAESDPNRDVIPYDPDWARYFRLEADGVFGVLAAREEGAIVGYNAFTVLPHLDHRASTFAVNCGLYVATSHRGSLFAPLIRRAEADLFKAGVAKIKYGSMRHVLLGRDGERKHRERPMLTELLERLGYRHEEDVCAKVRPQ